VLALWITSRWLGNASTQVNSICSRPQDVLQATRRRFGDRTPASTTDSGSWQSETSTLNDPLMGQGEYGIAFGFCYGLEILNDGNSFDEFFCRRTAARLDHASMVTEWNNYMVQVPPAPNVLQLLLSASQEKQ